MKQLKEKLPATHCIVHMDFAENFSCKSVQEIQSAYWNQTSVTVHPIVVYYKLNGSDEMSHKSIVVISDEMGHNAATVLTIIDKLVPELKSLDPELSHIHYWTDGPTSQYRNKAIFNTIANHKDIYGMTATWNYWEAGHGKGPCDGLGGTVKRMADDAINAGKVAIQDPSDFYAWSQSTHCSMKSVRFMFVSAEDCQKKAMELAKVKLKPIHGTMKLHAAKGKGNSIVAIRDTSCYCDTCVTYDTCDTWRNVTTVSSASEEPNVAGTTSQADPSTLNLHPSTVSGPTELLSPVPEHLTSHDTSQQIKVSDFVAAVYVDKWYIGQVINIDQDDNTYEITFLEQKKKSFQWPARSDIIWVEGCNIICKVSDPKAVGKKQRMLSIDVNDIKTVESLFSQR